MVRIRVGRYAEEIVSVTTTMAVIDKEGGSISKRKVTVAMDDCNRPSSTYEGLAKLEPVRGQASSSLRAMRRNCPTAPPCVLMDAKEAERANLTPLGAFRGYVVAGCEPDEMGIGPVFEIYRSRSD